MYLLNEKLKGFFTPVVIFALMSCVLFFFSENKDVNTVISYYTALILAFSLIIIIFLIYIVYPLIKILLKNYGTTFQRIIVLLILCFSLLAMYFSSTYIIYIVWILYLAIFLNFASNIENNGNGGHIVSFPIGKCNYRHNFSKMLNSSLFNILMTVVLLTVVVAESLYFFNPYVILSTIPAITLVSSSVFYGKSSRSIKL